MRQIADDFLYSQVAERLETMVERGVWKIGDKLPSVRALSDEQGISMSTAFKAYAALESKGIIEARPKSGYYVRFKPHRQAEQPRTPRYTPPPIGLSVDEMIDAVYANLSEAGVVQLSIAAPGPELLPAAKLNKCLLEALRSSPTSCLHYENVQGNERLRQQLARQAFNWGGKSAAAEIIVTQGCMEALAFCLRSVTRPGDTVAIERPTYFGIFGLLKNLGLRALVLYCSSMSKSLAPGYRVVWCLPGRFFKKVLRQKLTHCITSPTPTQDAIARFCETGRFDLHLRHLRKALYTQCLRYWQAIAEYFPEETRVSQPQGGYVLWLELPENVDAFHLYHRARQHQINIAPGQIFSTDGRFSHHLRLGFGAPYSAEIEQSLKTLGRLVKQLA